MIEEFKRYQQQLITAIHDYETKREALRTSRSQVHEHKLKLLRIGDEFEVDGKIRLNARRIFADRLSCHSDTKLRTSFYSRRLNL